MTAPRTFERDLPVLLEDLYLGGTPDYRDDLVRRTAAMRQRPAWTFLERWIPMDLALRGNAAGRFPLRTAAMLLVLALLIAAIATAAVYFGAPRLAPPLGPASNGPLVFSASGDILIRDGLSGETRVLIGGSTLDSYPGFNGEGSRFLFERNIGDERFLMVADANGQNIGQVLPMALDDPWIAWSIDGRSVAMTDTDGPLRTLTVAAVDGSEIRTIDIGRLRPTDVQFRPPGGQELLLRVMNPEGKFDLATVGLDGRNLKRFNLPSPLLYGADWETTGAAWSPDGRHIAYNQVELDTVTGLTHFRIHVINADGTGDRTLEGPAADVNEAWPYFSPNGEWILAQRFDFDDQTSWLAVTPADGSAPGRDIGPVRTGPDREGDNMRQGWSPDGTKVLLRYNDDQFWVIDPATGEYDTLPWPAAEDIPDWRRVAP